MSRESLSPADATLALAEESKRNGLAIDAAKAELARLTQLQGAYFAAMTALNGGPAAPERTVSPSVTADGDTVDTATGEVLVRASTGPAQADAAAAGATETAEAPPRTAPPTPEPTPEPEPPEPTPEPSPEPEPKPPAKKKTAKRGGGRPSREQLLGEVRALGKKMNVELGLGAEATKAIRDAGSTNWREADATMLGVIKRNMEEAIRRATEDDGAEDFD